MRKLSVTNRRLHRGQQSLCGAVLPAPTPSPPSPETPCDDEPSDGDTGVAHRHPNTAIAAAVPTISSPNADNRLSPKAAAAAALAAATAASLPSLRLFFRPARLPAMSGAGAEEASEASAGWDGCFAKIALVLAARVDNPPGQCSSKELGSETSGSAVAAMTGKRLPRRARNSARYGGLGAGRRGRESGRTFWNDKKSGRYGATNNFVLTAIPLAEGLAQQHNTAVPEGPEKCNKSVDNPLRDTPCMEMNNYSQVKRHERETTDLSYSKHVKGVRLAVPHREKQKLYFSPHTYPSFLASLAFGQHQQSRLPGRICRQHFNICEWRLARLTKSIYPA